MRRIRIDAREFTRFVWPAIGFPPVENGGEVDAQIRLLGMLKPASTPMPVEDGDELLGVPGRTLDTDELTLTLEEDEWGRLKKALKEWRTRVAGGVVDEFKALQDRVNDAEQFKADEAEATE